mmetsp:Transcript_7099/g.12887  ORF Transcript_7099/g.12887 Transcript_7099/m.12887 type:complete len:289 (+) Transcript_7099:103-969(+)
MSTEDGPRTLEKNATMHAAMEALKQHPPFRPLLMDLTITRKPPRMTELRGRLATDGVLSWKECAYGLNRLVFSVQRDNELTKWIFGCGQSNLQTNNDRVYSLRQHFATADGLRTALVAACHAGAVSLAAFLGRQISGGVRVRGFPPLHLHRRVLFVGVQLRGRLLRVLLIPTLEGFDKLCARLACLRHRHLVRSLEILELIKHCSVSQLGCLELTQQIVFFRIYGIPSISRRRSPALHRRVQPVYLPLCTVHFHARLLQAPLHRRHLPLRHHQRVRESAPLRVVPFVP